MKMLHYARDLQRGFRFFVLRILISHSRYEQDLDLVSARPYFPPRKLSQRTLPQRSFEIQSTVKTQRFCHSYDECYATVFLILWLSSLSGRNFDSVTTIKFSFTQNISIRDIILYRRPYFIFIIKKRGVELYFVDVSRLSLLSRIFSFLQKVAVLQIFLDEINLDRLSIPC